MWFHKLIAVICLLHASDGLYLEGRLKTVEDWVFLGRFCFLSDIGRMQFKFAYPFEDCCNNILMYFDDGMQWPKVYKNDSKNCFEKEAVLGSENNQIINLTTRYLWSGCQLANYSHEGGTGLLQCDGGRSFRSLHERWWYIAISNCKAGAKGKGIDLTYEMKLTNGHSYWTEHFSADEFGMLETNLFFLILFTLMFVTSLYIASYLFNRQLLHTTYKMFLTCLVLEVFSLLLLCVALGTYASDGVGNDGLKLIGEVLGASAELLFLLLLLLLGKGFTITRGQLSYCGTIKMSVFTTVYAVIDIVLFLYEYVLFDPGLVLYVYESPAGYGLIALRLAGWFWFTYGIIVTLKHYPEKNGFYYPLYTVYSIWFYAVPIMVLVASYAIPRYMRAKIVNALQRCIDFVAYAVFMMLTRPQAANHNFPYHVRTSQIGVGVIMANGKPCTTSSFPHQVYAEPPANNCNDTVYDLFTVQTNLQSTPCTMQASNEYCARSQITRKPSCEPPPYSAGPSGIVPMEAFNHRRELPGNNSARTSELIETANVQTTPS